MGRKSFFSGLLETSNNYCLIIGDPNFCWLGRDVRGLDTNKTNLMSLTQFITSSCKSLGQEKHIVKKDWAKTGPFFSEHRFGKPKPSIFPIGYKITCREGKRTLMKMINFEKD